MSRSIRLEQLELFPSGRKQKPRFNWRTLDNWEVISTDEGQEDPQAQEYEEDA